MGPACCPGIFSLPLDAHDSQGSPHHRGVDAFGHNSWRKQNGMACFLRLLRSKEENCKDHAAGRVEGLESPKMPIRERAAVRKPETRGINKGDV